MTEEQIAEARALLADTESWFSSSVNYRGDHYTTELSCDGDRAVELFAAALTEIERLKAQVAALEGVLTQAAFDVCSLHCPSVKRTPAPWTHCARCIECQEALAKARGEATPAPPPAPLPQERS